MLTIDVESKPAKPSGPSLYYFYRVVTHPNEPGPDDAYSIYSGIFELSPDFTDFIEIDRIICETVKEKNEIPADHILILDFISKL